MILLLDSHAFVWWRDEPHKLSATAFAEISNTNNEIFLSVVSIWELQIKIALNKFSIKNTLKDAVEDEERKNGFQILPVQLSHIFYLESLLLHHKDPFDRLLIAQANVEKMFLISSDKIFSDYSINLLW